MSLPCRAETLFVAGALLALALTGCHRENRYFTAPPGADAAPEVNSMSALVRGKTPSGLREKQRREYEESAFHQSEGKRLFDWFNCTGCHAHGGGDIGPALMDERWTYGGEIDQIYRTIEEGRPNGMPSFGGKIPPRQIWQIAAYVRSMSGHGPKAARPGRDDDMQMPAEQGRQEAPVNPVSPPDMN